jgi:ankyrin repeat protein
MLSQLTADVFQAIGQKDLASLTKLLEINKHDNQFKNEKGDTHLEKIAELVIFPALIAKQPLQELKPWFSFYTRCPNAAQTLNTPFPLGTINFNNFVRMTFAQFGAATCDVAFLRFLKELNVGVDFNLPSVEKTKLSPLLMAIFFGTFDLTEKEVLETVPFLIEKCLVDITYADSDGDDPGMGSIAKKTESSHALIRYLGSVGVDYGRSRKSDGRTTCDQAYYQCDDATEKLVRGIKNSPSEFLRAPAPGRPKHNIKSVGRCIYDLIGGRQVTEIRHLFENLGVDPNCVMDDSNTPVLFYAVIRGNWEIMNLFKEFGANFDLRDSDKENVFFQLKNADGTMDRVELAKFLLANGADPSVVVKDGETLLHRYADYDTDWARQLIKLFVETKKIDVNASNASGYTAAHLAASSACLDVLETLVAAGADLSIRSDIGKTCLDLILERDPSGATATYLSKLFGKWFTQLATKHGFPNVHDAVYRALAENKITKQVFLMMEQKNIDEMRIPIVARLVFGGVLKREKGESTNNNNNVEDNTTTVAALKEQLQQLQKVVDDLRSDVVTKLRK